MGEEDVPRFILQIYAKHSSAEALEPRQLAELLSPGRSKEHAQIELPLSREDAGSLEWTDKLFKKGIAISHREIVLDLTNVVYLFKWFLLTRRLKRRNIHLFIFPDRVERGQSS